MHKRWKGRPERRQAQHPGELGLLESKGGPNMKHMTVLAFLKLHKEHPNVRKLLAEEDADVAELNKSLGTDYRDFLDYLERNSGDDAPCTMGNLKALLARKR